MTGTLWTARCEGCNHSFNLKNVFRRWIKPEHRKHFDKYCFYFCRGCMKLTAPEED